MSTEPPVFATPLNKILETVFLDGFISGLSSGCAQFLPADQADSYADKLLATTSSEGFLAEVRKNIEERMQEMFQQIAATGKPVPGLKPSDLAG